MTKRDPTPLQAWRAAYRHTSEQIRALRAAIRFMQAARSAAISTHPRSLTDRERLAQAWRAAPHIPVMQRQLIFMKAVATDQMLIDRPAAQEASRLLWEQSRAAYTHNSANAAVGV